MGRPRLSCPWYAPGQYAASARSLAGGRTDMKISSILCCARQSMVRCNCGGRRRAVMMMVEDTALGVTRTSGGARRRVRGPTICSAAFGSRFLARRKRSRQAFWGSGGS